jgi:hypothetical protein
LSGDIKTDLKALLPPGTHTADLMDGIRQTPRQAALTVKFNNALKKNYEWFVDYTKNIPPGELMPYHPNTGLTEAEYKELIAHLKNVEVVSTGKESILIEQKGDTIVFKSQGKLYNFNSLKIDTKSNTAFFEEYAMPFTDSVNIKTDKNGLRSKWKGYKWGFKMPADVSPDDLKDLRNLEFTEYKLTIGRLEKNGKTYIDWSGTEVQDGAKQVYFNLRVVF